MQFPRIVEDFMNDIQKLPNFKQKFSKYSFNLCLNVNTHYLAIIYIYDGQIEVDKKLNNMKNIIKYKNTCNGYVESSIPTFIKLAYWDLGIVDFFYMILKKELKFKGLLAIMKFQKIIKFRKKYKEN